MSTKIEDVNGVWRTIGGRRVFIKDGQSLSEAMISSGKFKNLRSEYKKAKEEENKKEAKKLDEELKTKGEKDVNEPSIHTQSGSYTPNELKNRDESIKQMYKDAWEGKKSYKELNDELEGLKKEGKVSQGELDALKYDASLETGDWQNNPKNAHNSDYIGDNKVKLKEEKEQGFIQQTDMHGGTREYTKEQLNKMSENGVKPMEHSYTGGGWEGTKYDSKLSTKEIAKNINDYAKKEFPDVKISRQTDYNGIDMYVMNSDKDLYVSVSDIDKMSDKQVSDTIRDSIGGYTRMDDWLNENNRKSPNGTFTANDERDYLKEQLNTYKNRKGDNVSGNEWYLSDYGKKVISGLNKEMNSYNYDDSDGMVDYFNTNFYGYVHIGKWDKPYQVNEKSTSVGINNSLRQKAYQKYLKEHPSSKMTFENFKDMRK